MRLLALTSLILASTLATGAFAAPAESMNYNVVNLSAEASREISNDEMHAVLYIEKSNKQPAELATQINQLMNQAIATARKYPTVKIETGAQSTYPIYDNDNRKLKEWRGRAQIRLESKDFKATSQLIAELQQHFQTQSLNFSISNEKRTNVENELMIEASKSFQQRAKTLTQAWNKANYQVVNLNINTNQYSSQPIPRMAMLKAASSADVAVPEQELQAGESSITVVVNGAIQMK
ncbi:MULTISPECIES: SIMPL domain-containing protein [unclassified Acinetobacter]|uniref:SIMPL domain-containing protein n=1 Tax=unclassified Acinetobacter TaxID=196816 RepID=UPI0015D3342A|nr:MULTISPECIES: SIMPL domain-containing protein [unclassified Acinetobacter]